MIIQDLRKSIEEEDLVMVEYHCARQTEFTGRRTLAERQQRLIMLHKLSSQPDDFFSDGNGLRPTGGNVMAQPHTGLC